MRTLVAQTIFLGDLILTLPLLQQLKKSFPFAEIDVLVLKGLENVLHNNPNISTIITYDKIGDEKGLGGIFKIAKRLKNKKYDVAFILPGSFKTAISVFLSQTPRRIGTNHSTGLLLFKDKIKYPEELSESPGGWRTLVIENFWKIFGGRNSIVSKLYTDVVGINPDLHAVDRHLQLLEPMNLILDERIPKLFPNTIDENIIDEYLKGTKSNEIICIAPGSVWKTKRWPEQKYIELIKKLIELKYSVLLIGGNADKIICSNIESSVNSSRLLNLCGKLSILQSTAVIMRSQVLVTNDTAPLHIASAVKTPCVALFGPTVQEFGFTPIGNRYIIVEKNLSCRPCTPHGGNHCPIWTHDCMEMISVEEVIEAVIKII
jgi:heptosyltransferase-2